MLAEFLEYRKSISWQTIAPGIQMCRFSVEHNKDQEPILISHKLRPLHMEILFCRGGSLSIERRKQPGINIGEQEILIYSDDTSFSQAEILGPLEGFFLSIETSTVRPGFKALCRILGNLELYSGQIRHMMAKHDGCCRIRSTPWTRAVFPVLEALPPKEQGRYCVIKSLELLYLLCTYHSLLERPSGLSMSWGYLARIVSEMREYMEQHLDEKLTISFMSHHFHISPTAFKRCFRSLYGQPVHSWLQEKRMQRAAELLSASPMTVLQVAQAVGYEGVSQFNVIFKRQYGVTPSQYRKMSVSGNF